MSTKLSQITESLNSSSTDTYALNASAGQVLNTIKLAGQAGTSTSATTISNVLENGEVYFSYDSSTTSTFNQALLNALFPIGTIYQTTSSTNPGVLFGGTWSQDGLEGRMLIGAGTDYSPGSTGGAASVTLTAAQSGMPAYTSGYDGIHAHVAMTLKIYNKAVVSGSNRTHFDSAGGAGTSTRTSSAAGSHRHWTASAAASAAHDNMPPYLVVYMWKRTN